MNIGERENYARVIGIIFDVQHYSLHDGPGLRTNVFFKGCPLRCGWCSNPESQRVEPEPAVFASRCIHCGQFDPPCPDLDRQINSIEQRIEDCPGGGVRWMGYQTTAGETIAQVVRDQVFYAVSGGLTLTGGEPLLQPGFAEALLRLAREECLTTAIETCGLAPWAAWERVLPLLNTILFDFKHINPDLHREFTGVANDLILENLHLLILAKAPLRIRIPLIPGFNADIQSAHQMADYLSNMLLPNMPIDLLPYHTLGRAKYTVLSRPFPWQGVEPMEFETAQSIAEIFRSRNLSVSIGG